MAYKSRPGASKDFKPFTGGLPNLSQIHNSLAGVEQRLRSTEFYELEATEVIDVILNEEDLPLEADGTPTYSLIGAIKGRMVNSQHKQPESRLGWIQPMDANIKQYPLIGEYVIVGRYLGRYYYAQTINMLGSPNSNSYPGYSGDKASLTDNTTRRRAHNRSREVGATKTPNKAASGEVTVGDPFVPNPLIRQLQPTFGDVIFNGRFGQSIRFGSNPDTLEPNILIRAGQLTDAEAFGKTADVDDLKNNANKPVTEDINADGSSLWITSDQEVPLEVAIESDLTPTIDGKQIILNSDRLLFNAKNGGDIFCYSANDINFIATTQTVVESPKIFLGNVEATEPVVKGQILVDLLLELIGILDGIHTVPTPAGPIPKLNVAQTTTGPLAKAFADIKGKVKDILSEQNFTV
jgi:hypothetical protein|tara:strand:- start:118 stop:1341 length:1224 start_codon:yes stop_codon:yes gene_type:complete